LRQSQQGIVFDCRVFKDASSDRRENVAYSSRYEYKNGMTATN